MESKRQSEGSGGDEFVPLPSDGSDREQRMQTICLLVILVILTGGSLYYLRDVLLPFILALFFVCGIAPLLNFIQDRLQVPRLVAVAITFLLGILLLAVLWGVIWLSVASLIDQEAVYRARFRELVSYLPDWLEASTEEPPTASTPPATSLPAAEVPADAIPDLNPGSAATVAPPVEKQPKGLSNFANELFQRGLSRLYSALMGLLSSGLMVLIFMFFMLLGDSTVNVVRSDTWNEIEGKIRNYIVTKSLISVVTGVAFGLALWLFGVPLALLFGLLAFLLNFIPNIGPIIASLLPVPLIVLHPELSLTSMIVVIGLTSVIQFVSGNIIEPKIMGDSFELHPVAILLTLMLWGMLWGIVGMFLATPITAAVKILLDKFELTRPVAQLLAGNLSAFQLAPETPAPSDKTPA